MANLHDIERRIASVKSTRQITSTMRMIAAAKVGKTAKRLDESMPYATAISKMLYSLSSHIENVHHPLLTAHENCKTSLIIAVVSDKGLAGGFNSNILRASQKIISSNKSKGKITKVIAWGKKAHGYFNFRNISIEKEYLGYSDNPQFEQAQEICNFCIEQYLSGEVDEVILIYNKCKNSMEQIVKQVNLLPCDNELDEVKDDDSNNQYIQEIVFEPSANHVLEELIPTYVRTIVFNALLDSAAGEQVARRVAMQAATDNADEMVETLTRLYNSVRQGAITTELNEIVGGADALKTE